MDIDVLALASFSANLVGRVESKITLREYAGALQYPNHNKTGGSAITIRNSQ
jgi:hypothetical protein